MCVQAGETTNTLRLNFGQTDIKSPGDVETQIRDRWAASGTLERGALRLNVGYLRARATVKGDEFQGFLMDTPMPAEGFAATLAGGAQGFYPRSLRVVR